MQVFGSRIGVQVSVHLKLLDISESRPCSCHRQPGQLITVYKRQLGVLQQRVGMSGTKLTQLFLFNPSWGPREGQEEEKVVFHWPAHLDANTRVRSVGLIEAVVRWEEISNYLFLAF